MFWEDVDKRLHFFSIYDFLAHKLAIKFVLVSRWQLFPDNDYSKYAEIVQNYGRAVSGNFSIDLLSFFIL